MVGDKEKHYKAPRMIVDHNQPCIGIAHGVCMYITGKVICKCMVEQNMTAYQIGCSARKSTTRDGPEIL